jgi:hypothetical protein
VYIDCQGDSNSDKVALGDIKYFPENSIALGYFPHSSK